MTPKHGSKTCDRTKHGWSLPLLLGLLLAGFTARAQGLRDQIPAAEYDALVDFYNATGGPGWGVGSGWLNPQATRWLGVGVRAGHVTSLDFSLEGLKGSIPASLGNLSQLQYLYLQNNQLSGSIPASLGNLTQLQTLVLDNNPLSGSIPESLGKLSKLHGLSLRNNQLSGSIPASLGNLAQLQVLYLDENQLSGSIPASLGNLAQLQYLYLDENQLNGSIPASLGNLTQLQNLSLSNNQLSGSLPESLGNLAKLRALILNSNQLSGNLPASLGNLAQLQWLDLQINQLSGSIPASLGNLAQLQWLDLQNNQLSGNIPASLGNLSQLRHLNLRANQLTGEVPAFSAFRDGYANIQYNALDIAYDSPSWANIEAMFAAGNSVEFLPQRKAQADLVSTSLAWNTSLGGIDFAYAVEGGPLNTATTAKLFWASGTTVGAILSEKPIFVHAIPAGFTGQSKPIHVPGADLVGAPKGTTHMILVLDRENQIAEAKEDNNSIPLRDTLVSFGPDADPNKVSQPTFDALVELYRRAGVARGTITSTARTPERQAQIMFDQMLDKSISTYKAPGERVKDVYKTKTKGLTKPQIIEIKADIIQAMVDQIYQEGPGNVSNHCADFRVLNVLDLSRNQFPSVSSRLRFVEAACSDPRVSKFLAPNAYQCATTIDPTYHLEFPQAAGGFSRVVNPIQRSAREQTGARRVNDLVSLELVNGAATASGSVSGQRSEFLLSANEGDGLSAVIFPSQILAGTQSTNGDSMIFVLDDANTLVASNDDSEDHGLNAGLAEVVLPKTGQYRLVVTTFPNAPELSEGGAVTNWSNNGWGNLEFDLEISLVPKNPRLYLSQISDGRLLLDWDGDQTLQKADRPDGNWTNETNVIRPHIIDISTGQSFFRLLDQ